jgi:hypothetical protein
MQCLVVEHVLHILERIVRVKNECRWSRSYYARATRMVSNEYMDVRIDSRT